MKYVHLFSSFYYIVTTIKYFPNVKFGATCVLSWVGGREGYKVIKDAIECSSCLDMTAPRVIIAIDPVK